MIKKIKYILILLLVIFPINIYAYELTCDSGSFTYGQNFSCKLSGDIKNYDKLSGTITHDDNISCERASIGSGLTESEGNTSTYFNLVGTPNNNELVTIKCSVTEKLTESTNTRVYIPDFTYHELNSGVDERKENPSSDYIKLDAYNEETPTDTKPRNVSNPDTRLKTLSAEGLNLTFSQFITEYNVEVLYEVEELNLLYTTNNQTSSVKVEGNTKLEVGNNIIDLYVTNASGTETTCYTLNITRLARGEDIYYPESDSSLESMTIPGFAIGFDKNVFEYKIHLTRDISNINVNAKTTYDGATISISPTDNLKNGSLVTVTVTSQDETNTTVYKINITKDAPKKDYSSIIILVVLGIALIGVIALFILTSQKKKKNDPLLSLKKSKRKMNKGESFDSSIVPETNEQNTISQTEDASVPVNTLNLNNSNTIAPTPTETTQVASFNQVTPVNNPTVITSPNNQISNQNIIIDQNSQVNNPNVIADPNTQVNSQFNNPNQNQ